MANIILVTHWTGGDVYPFIRLGNILSRKNHEVTIITHCVYENIARENNLNFVAIDSPEEFEEMNVDLHMLTDPIKDTQATLTFNSKHHGEKRLIREYKKITSCCNKNNTVILARHRSSISALLAAEKLSIPYASVVLAPNYLDHMTLHNQVFGKQMIEEINKARVQLNLNPILDWKDWLYSPKRILGVWPDWFASPERDWPSTLVPIGFMENKITNYNDFPSEVNDIIASGDKVVLISGGTTKMVSPNFYKVAADACAISGYKGILVTRYDELVPSPLPRGVVRAKELNLSYLLTKVDAIIHHGGMGTLNESIVAGVPQIILPHLTDGPDNAYRLQKLGIAKLLPISRWNAFDIAVGLKAMIENDNANVALYADKLKNQYIRQDFISIIEEMVDNQNYTVNSLVENSKKTDSQTPIANKGVPDKFSNLTQIQKKFLLSKLNQKDV